MTTPVVADDEYLSACSNYQEFLFTFVGEDTEIIAKQHSLAVVPHFTVAKDTPLEYADAMTKWSMLKVLRID